MRTLIISDLHLGNGGPYDVFEGGDELPSLLDRLSRQAPLRALVNGDGVDFLMNEDPLELDEARAVAQARAIAQSASSKSVFEAFGRVLARGGEVTLRLGNHDVELSFPAVQSVFRDALFQPENVAAKLTFEPGLSPGLLTLGGARVLVTHGEQSDRWNKVDYKRLVERDRLYQYAPGSMLVKKILNPGVARYGLRFLSLLKPDFHGAALAALAVEPMAVRHLFGGSAAAVLVQLFRAKGMAATFAAESAPALFEDGVAEALSEDAAGLLEDALGERLGMAALDDEEHAALRSLLDEGCPQSFADEEEGVSRSASVKVARAALSLYAGLHRGMTGTAGEEYFRLEPTADEWAEARRLARKFAAGAVVLGHTHAARWKQEGGLLYANTGTWAGLMQLPRPDASWQEWADFLHELRVNKELNPESQRRAKVVKRFTAVLADEHADGGAELALLEWEGGAPRTLKSSRVSPAEVY